MESWFGKKLEPETRAGTLFACRGGGIWRASLARVPCKVSHVASVLAVITSMLLQSPRACHHHRDGESKNLRAGSGPANTSTSIIGS